MNEQERHNRNVMLRRVRTVWLQDVLEKSLHGGEIIDLGFAYRPSALADSGVPAWQQAAEYDYLLPVGTTIDEVFAAAGGELLILGEPGAGKTTMLLQLVSHLLAQAEGDERCPMPAVFSLAGYDGGRPFDEWLVDELANNYEVPRKLGAAWISSAAFIPLLDGLDEVDADQRRACAEAINAFRHQYEGVSMLVTTRNLDYQAIALRLNLEKAIMLQPLNADQINEYLARRGKRLAGLRTSLKADATLRELAGSPLMLSIMTLAYYRLPEDIALELSNGQLSRQLLFDVYVERMARYRSGDGAYPPDDTVRWLTFLSQRLALQNRPTFFLEDIQPTWLRTSQTATFGRWSRLVVFGLLAGAGVVAALVALLLFGWRSGVVALGVGLPAAAVPALTGRFLIRGRLSWRRVETVESLIWSWAWAGLGLTLGALGGLALGLLIAAFDEATVVPWLVLVPIGAGLGQMVENALLRSDVRLRTAPGQGVQLSWQNGRMVGLLVAVVVAALSLAGALVAQFAGADGALRASLPWISGVTLYLGLGYGLTYGTLAALQHRRLLSQLEADGLIPTDLPRFLDYAAERNLLRKVGGGYSYVHALLQDYFNLRANGDHA
jgi:hypothetical protein